MITNYKHWRLLEVVMFKLIQNIQNDVQNSELLEMPYI